MWFELFLAALLAAIGSITFGKFEEKTALWRRLLKLGIYLSVTGLLSYAVGRFWSLVWLFALPALGSSFHVWWCRKHGIGVFTAEPRDRYYELRGWK